MLKYALLGFLNYFPMTGYELESYMSATTAYFWHAKLSQIYTTLKKLEEEGLLRSQVEPQEERPDRRVYSVTEAGRKELLGWLQEPLTELEPKKDALLLKVFFAAQAGKETVLTQLRLQLRLHERQLQYYREQTPALIERTVGEFPQLADDGLLWEASRRHGELYEEMYVRWLDETIHKIEEAFPE